MVDKFAIQTLKSSGSMKQETDTSLANDAYRCELCDKSYTKLSALGVHIKRTHKYDIKKYYDIFIDSTNHRCICCGKQAKFMNLSGYQQTCGEKHCVNTYKNIRSTQACLAKYGVNTVFKLKETTDKMKRTKLEKYGDSNYNNKEKREQTCLDKYGVKHNWASKELREAGQYRTCEERYGNRNYNGNRIEAVEKWKTKTHDTINKMKETCLEKYGVDSYTKTQEFKDKFSSTCLEKYGVDHNFKANECIEKRNDTLLEKYGVDSYTKTDEFKEKLKNTCLEKYGVDNYSKTDEFKEKLKSINQEKYGVDSFFQSNEYREHLHEYHKKKRAGIIFDGYSFDSKPEFELYKFCIENGIKVEYHPCAFHYFDSFDVEHLYIPDFRIDGTFYEIKGSHLIKDGKLYTPYRNGLTEDEIARLDARDLAKTKCLLENGIHIIPSNEVNILKQKLLNEVQVKV